MTGFVTRVNAPWWVGKVLKDRTQFRTHWITKGLGSGGTYGLALWHYLMCQINAKSRFSWCLAPTYIQVRNVLLPTFAEVWADKFGLREGRDFRIVSSGQPRIELHETGQEIRFYSASKPERLVGDNISHCSGTEVGLWARLAYAKSSMRIRCPKATVLQYLGEGTPEGMNWWQEEADFPDGVDEARNYRRVTLWTDDNKHLPEGYVEKQIVAKFSYDPSKVISYRYGRFVPFTKGTAYWEWFDQRNVRLGLEIQPSRPICMNWDFGVTPLPWVAMQLQPHTTRAGDFVNRFVAICEGSGKARGVQDACAEFIAAVPPAIYRDVPIHLYGGHDGYSASPRVEGSTWDQIAKILKRYYAKVEIRASRAAPEIIDRLNRVNSLLAHELFVVSPQCTNLIGSLSKTALKPGTWEFVKHPADKDFSHFSDAVGDMLFTLSKGWDLEQPSRKVSYGVNR